MSECLFTAKWFWVRVHLQSQKWDYLLNHIFYNSLMKNRVWFNDSWFIFHDSSWSFHEPYFSRKKKFQESFRVNRISTKLFNNIIILKTFLLTISFIIQFFIEQRFCKYHLLRSQKQQNYKMRLLTMQAFVYYLIFSGVRDFFHKIMQHKEIWFVM